MQAAKLKKVRTASLKVTQDINCVPVVRHSSITDWMIFARVSLLKDPVFLMLDIAKLRSMQYQDADNWISDPEDLVARMLFRPCKLVPNLCLDVTFWIRVQNSSHLSGRCCAALIIMYSVDFSYFFICKPAAAAPQPGKIHYIPRL